jgi:hypothetical protein
MVQLCAINGIMKEASESITSVPKNDKKLQFFNAVMLLMYQPAMGLF